MSTARDLHTTTRLTDGTVLVVGGLTGGFTDPDIVTTELYNPATNSWSPGPNTSGARVGHTATLLRDGRVLVAGGFGSSPVLRTGAELFGPLGAGTDRFAQADDVSLLAKPRLGSSVNIARVRGVVTVRLPGRTDPISIEKAAHVPLGSIIDTTHGQVRLYSVGEKSGALQNGLFYDGAFKIGQITKGVPLTVLALTAGDASVCKGFRPASSRPATGVVQIKGSTRRGDPAQNHLWGNGKGHFRTKGKGSYATVRGTIWNVENHCFTTHTTVRRGVVAVFDRGLHRTILVHAGDGYVAKLR
jgi:hypothetical protein